MKAVVASEKAKTLIVTDHIEQHLEEPQLRPPGPTPLLVKVDRLTSSMRPRSGRWRLPQDGSRRYMKKMIDRRFPTALQIMQSLVLAETKSMDFISSAAFADGLKANPTLVRKLLTTLVRHGLLESQMGRNGGVRLARPADRIALSDIYVASIEGKKLWKARPDLPQMCVVSMNFEQWFGALVDAADRAVLDMLGSRTLADSFDELVAIELSKAPDRRCADADEIARPGLLPTT